MKNKKWSHIPDPVNALAAQILDALDFLGAWHKPVKLRSLYRKLNANKLLLWNDALARLVQGKCITMEAGPRRQQSIKIIEVPEHLWPIQIVNRPKRKRKRGQTEWFKRHVMGFRRQEGDDDGLQAEKSPLDGSTEYEDDMS